MPDVSTQNEIVWLKGNFDILLLNTCSLSCKHCCFLDLPDRFSKPVRPKFVWSLDAALEKLDQYTENGIGFEHITLLGGEPTLHPRFTDIVNAFQTRRGLLFKGLQTVSNMTNLSPATMLSLSRLDRVTFSVYEVNAPLVKALIETGLLDWLRAQTEVHFGNCDEFEVYGEPDLSFTGNYDQVSNWTRCPYKSGARVLSPSGVSYCHMAYANGEDTGSMQITEVDQYLNRMTPLSSCAACPMPARREKWSSANSVRDHRSTMRGLSLLGESASVLIQGIRPNLEVLRQCF
jgi:hypothetical protein